MMQNDLFTAIAPEMEELAPGVFLFQKYIDEELFFNQAMKVAKQLLFVIW